MSIQPEQAAEDFQNRYGEMPEAVVRAPGRVNIIGEHTDYNHGFVLPMAIERDIVICARRRDDQRLRAYAANLDEEALVSLEQRERSEEAPWTDYIVGVADELVRADHPICGADILLRGDVPVASGLSSSASLEMAALVMFESLCGSVMGGPEAAQLGQRVENHFMGVNSGIMDQFISRMGEEGKALFLDCRTLEFETVEVAFPDATFVIADTGVARGLTASKYNERVAECNAAVEAMNKHLGREHSHLRDFRREELEAAREKMTERAYRRARHVLTENERTVDAREVMRKGDAAALGALMNQSDASLRDDYEVTCRELDVMTETAREIEGCLGSRMTGAGFGGCTVSLVRKNSVSAFSDELMRLYEERTGKKGAVIISGPAAGAGRVQL